jgi:hypothetical protein
LLIAEAAFTEFSFQDGIGGPIQLGHLAHFNLKGLTLALKVGESGLCLVEASFQVLHDIIFHSVPASISLPHLVIY